MYCCIWYWAILVLLRPPAPVFAIGKSGGLVGTEMCSGVGWDVACLGRGCGLVEQEIKVAWLGED